MNSINGIIIDVATIAIFIFVFFSVARKGFLKSSYKLFAIIATLIITSAFSSQVADFVYKSKIGSDIHSSIEQKIYEKSDFNLPTFLMSKESKNELQSEISGAVSDEIVKNVSKIISVIILFIGIRLLLFLLFILLSVLFKLPVLSTLNKLLGSISALLHALLCIYLLCAIIAIPLPCFDSLKGCINDSIITSFFYNNNLLFQLFI